MTLESATKLQINEGHGENFFFGRGHSCRFSNSREGIRGGQGVNIIFLDMDQKDRQQQELFSTHTREHTYSHPQLLIK